MDESPAAASLPPARAALMASTREAVASRAARVRAALAALAAAERLS